MSKTKAESHKSLQKQKMASVLLFKAPSRFSGGSLVGSQFSSKSQYKPTPVRITQHKG